MTRLLAHLAVLAACAGCLKEPPPSSAQLVKQAKAALVEREGRLKSYHLVVESKEQGLPDATHDVYFRAPYRIRGVVRAPSPMRISFDGTRLYQVDDQAHVFTTLELKPGSADVANALHERFAQLVPEGFSAPLLPSKGVTAARVGDTVELTLSTADGATPVSMTWVFKWPGFDFVAKRTAYGQKTYELKVEAERCDEVLKLCLPKKLSRWQGGKQVGELSLPTIELNVDLPQDDFSLSAPEGYQQQTRSL